MSVRVVSVLDSIEMAAVQNSIRVEMCRDFRFICASGKKYVCAYIGTCIPKFIKSLRAYICIYKVTCALYTPFTSINIIGLRANV